jgi:rare lipoprotein A
MFSGCAKHHAGRASVPPPKPARIGASEKGVASWYGEPYHGRRAASGEIYDMEQLTAAHRTLPFQTWVEVTNLKNGKHVDVRITDRGPFVDGRIIDLSRAAAREIDMLRMGIAPVRLRVIKPPRVSSVIEPVVEPSVVSSSPPLPATKREFAVQAGAFRDLDRAEAFAASLLIFPSVRVVPPNETNRSLWKPWVGKGLSLEAANSLAEELKSLVEQAFVVEERPDFR